MNSIEIELESAVGPRVIYTDGTTELEIEAELPDGWAVDYSSQVRTSSGRWSSPLVQSVSDAPETISLRAYMLASEMRYIHTLERADREGYRINSYSHESAPQGLVGMTVQEAADLAAEDQSLIYLVKNADA